MTDKIDWRRVQDACERSRSGIPRPGDQELCEAAYKADPEKYKQVRRQAVQDADSRVNPAGRPPEES